MQPQVWRCLEERLNPDQFSAATANEFPAGLWDCDGTATRRDFLGILGASLALLGIGGCGSFQQPEEPIVPYVEIPEHAVPGQPKSFATAMPFSGGGIGLLVESTDGRPTKIEGNPEHPASLGATDIYAQATLLDLYDPQRSQVVLHRGRISSWGEFNTALSAQLNGEKSRDGSGLRILTEPILSPTLAAQVRELLQQFPRAKWTEYEPLHREMARAGAISAFGGDVVPRYDLAKADVIVSIDSDILGMDPGRLHYARSFAKRRNPEVGQSQMTRLYAVEATPSLTGVAADHRLVLTPPQIPAFALRLAARCGIDVRDPAGTNSFGPEVERFLAALIDDLHAAGSRALVVAGCWQSAEVHALVHVLNQELGAVGTTVDYLTAPEMAPNAQSQPLRELTRDMRADHVQTLIIIGANPVFVAPQKLSFAEALDHVPFRVHYGLYTDETSLACVWHIPGTHYLESWSDVRAFDGTVSLIQPLIAPLYGGRSVHELFETLLGRPDRKGYDRVRETWHGSHGDGDFETFWRKSLHDGIVAGTASEPITFSDSQNVRAARLPEMFSPPASRIPNGTAKSVTVLFRPDPSLWDGRFAANAWLQELPKPFSSVTWDNPALISPATARSLGAASGDEIELQFESQQVRLPVWILPGQADGTVTLQIGGGRRHAGHVGTARGFDVLPLRRLDDPWNVSPVTIRVTGTRHKLAATQEHHLMENRRLVQHGTIQVFGRSPDAPPFVSRQEKLTSLYPDINSVTERISDPSRTQSAAETPDDAYAWGMSIDLGACIGCRACMVACQAENNIPVVGKDQVANGREMHWIRVDTYFVGEPSDPEVFHLPVPCMHCEHAPCEPVCPVAATTHSAEGLNEMTYNRCIGTRYCSNNCPYKVRRFNFLDYHQEVRDAPVLQLLMNPEVTVRSRGVMEKCTYCVQRISRARILAKHADRLIADGEVLTACQQVCPTQAIVFGDLRDPESRVSKLKRSSLNYGLLEDLNTRPRTTYLAAVKNPNLSLAQPAENQQT